ncbi:MAG: hypothetical protein AB8H03_09225 [Saprospiraceae bacterium]
MYTSSPSIKSSFAETTQDLNPIKQSIDEKLLILQDKIKLLRNSNLSLISNSHVSLYNDLISLYYRTKLHFDNCKIYLEIIDDLELIDSSLHLQLSGLITISKELTNEFFFLQKRYNSTHQKQRVINA